MEFIDCADLSGHYTTTMPAQVKKNQSLGRAFAVLEFLADHPTARLKDVAAATGLAPPTALRFLGTLVDLGYVRQRDAIYLIAPRLAALGRGLWNQDSSNHIATALDQVADTLGLTAFFVVREEDEALYLHRAQPRHAAMVSTQRIGRRVPLYCSGVGKIFLAEEPEPEQHAYCRRTELRPYTDNTIVDDAHLLRILRRVRGDGYGLDEEECELGVRCIAVPVRDSRGQLRAAMSVSGSATAFPEAKLVLPVLRQAAAELAPFLNDGV